jgi:hypothetical protein
MCTGTVHGTLVKFEKILGIIPTAKVNFLLCFCTVVVPVSTEEMMQATEDPSVLCCSCFTISCKSIIMSKSKAEILAVAAECHRWKQSSAPMRGDLDNRQGNTTHPEQTPKAIYLGRMLLSRKEVMIFTFLTYSRKGSGLGTSQAEDFFPLLLKVRQNSTFTTQTPLLSKFVHIFNWICFLCLGTTKSWRKVSLDCQWDIFQL